MKKTLHKICLMLALLAFPFLLSAQGNPKTIDSLKKILLAQQDDTNKVNTLNQLNQSYLPFYFKQKGIDSSLKYARLLLSLSQKLSYKKGMGLAFLFFLALDNYTGNYQQALKDGDTSLSFFKEAGFKKGMIYVYNNLFDSYYKMNDIPGQNRMLYESIKGNEELGDKKNVSFGQVWLGFNYYVEENYEMALKTYAQALETFKQLGTDSGAAQCYIYPANIYLMKKKYKEAAHYDSIGLKIALRDHDIKMIGNAYFCSGNILSAQMAANDRGRPSGRSFLLDTVLWDYGMSLKYAKMEPDSGSMGDTYERICNVYINTGNLVRAQKYADSALLMAKATNQYDNFEKSFQAQARLDSAKGDFRKALSSYKEYVRYRDSIVNESNLRQATQIQMQNEFDRKEAAARGRPG